jgi:glycosyl transferase family 87
MGQTYAPPIRKAGLLGHRRPPVAAYDAPVTTSTSAVSLARLRREPRVPLRRATLRAMRDGAIVACLVLAVAHLLGLLDIGVDAYTYWTVDPASPYSSSAPGTAQAYFYSPAFAQLTAPIHLLPWQVFVAAWTVLLTAALLWQSGLWLAVALLLPPVFVDLTVGNIHLLLGAAIVLGFRWPWTWAFVLLTKITPGVGLLWFAFRREWRNLAIALGATAAIAGVSFVYAPDLWRQWFDLLVAATRAPDWKFLVITIPVWFRLPFAVALLYWGARTDRPWTVPAAACLAVPVLWLNAFAMLVAIVPLLAGTNAEAPARRWLEAGRRQPDEASAAVVST